MKRIFILLLTLLLLAGCESTQRESPSPAPAQSSEPERLPESIEPSASPFQTMTLTIPEGYTLARIGMLLEEKGFCTAEEFVAATQEGDFEEYSLLAEQPFDSDRCFALEGYLYPDTYEIFSGESIDSVIRRMLDNTELKFSETIRGAIRQSSYTTDEIITLASIIEKEANGPPQMAMISSVLHNRLNDGMQLQCDVTINYVEHVIYPFSTDENPQRFAEVYSTYKCAALPPGAICNPSVDAVLAALSPAKSEYFFFNTDEYGTYYYGETWEEHTANVAAAEEKNRQKAAEDATSSQ